MGKGSSKAPSGPQEVVQTTSNLPEYAKPYFEELLGRTMYESTTPYEAFPGQRLADFTPYEQIGMQGMYDMAMAGSPIQTGMASDIAAQIGYQPSNMGMEIADRFQPQPVISDYTAGIIDPGYTAGDIGQGYTAGQRRVEYTPTAFDSGYTAGDLGPGYTARELTSNLRPVDFDAGYTARPDQTFDPLGSDIISRYEAERAASNVVA